MRTSALIVLLCVGCRGPTPVPASDRDGDGFASDVDCDDTDAQIHPAAEERCDERDNDCDGRVDADAVDTTPWYRDGDGDGFGSDDLGMHCAAPEPDAVEVDGDCDDTRADVHPGGEDLSLCDGLDRDCDGTPEGPVQADEQAWPSLARALAETATGTRLHLCAGRHVMTGDHADIDLVGSGDQSTLLTHATGTLSGEVSLQDLALVGETRPALVGTPETLRLTNVSVRAELDLFDVDAGRVVARGLSLLTSKGREARLAASVDLDLEGVTFGGSGRTVLAGRTQLRASEVLGTSLRVEADEGATIEVADLAVTSNGLTLGAIELVALDGTVRVDGVSTQGTRTTTLSASAGRVEWANLEVAEGALEAEINATKTVRLSGVSPSEAEVFLQVTAAGSITVTDVAAQSLVARSTSGGVAFTRVAAPQLTANGKGDVTVQDVVVSGNASFISEGSATVDGLDGEGQVGFVAPTQVQLVDARLAGFINVLRSDRVVLQDVDVRPRSTGAGGAISLSEPGLVEIERLTVESRGAGRPALSMDRSARLTGYLEDVSIDSDAELALSVSPFYAVAFRLRDVIVRADSGRPLQLATLVGGEPASFVLDRGRYAGRDPILLEKVNSASLDAVGLAIKAPDCAVQTEAGCSALGDPATAICSQEGCK